MDESLEILKVEYLRCCGEVERLLTQNEKVVQLGALIGGGLIYTSYTTNSRTLHLLVPITLVGILLYLVNVHEFAMTGRAYIAHLEKEINHRVKQNVLRWENEHAETRVQYLWTTIALLALGVCVCLLGSAASFYTCSRLPPPSFIRKDTYSFLFHSYIILWGGLLIFAVIRAFLLGHRRRAVIRALRPGKQKVGASVVTGKAQP